MPRRTNASPRPGNRGPADDEDRGRGATSSTSLAESTRGIFQLLPPLTAEEYEALKADIADHGIRVPVDVDEDGNLLDGHHRAQIAAELGIDYPTRTVAGLTEAMEVAA